MQHIVVLQKWEALYENTPRASRKWIVVRGFAIFLKNFVEVLEREYRFEVEND